MTNEQHTPEELAEIRRIYRTITRQRTPSDANDPFVFSCRTLAGARGIEEQWKWKASKKNGVSHVHDDWALWSYLSGQAIHEDLERGLAETEGIASSEEYISETYEGGIKVWSSLDIAADGEVIQVKTTEQNDPAIFTAHILQAGWEAVVKEKQSGKKVKAAVWKVYQKPGGYVGANVHILTEQEKEAGYREIVNRAKQCASLVQAWKVAQNKQPPANVKQVITV